MVERTGIKNEVLVMLHKSRLGLTANTIYHNIDSELFPNTTFNSCRSLLSQLVANNSLRTEKQVCNECHVSHLYYYITDTGRLNMTENTGVVDIPDLEHYINATANVEHVAEV